MSQDLKKALKHHRENVKEDTDEKGLVEELGEGVEPEPEKVEDADLDKIPNLDISSTDDVRHIFDELKMLPSIKDVGDQLKKHDAYNLYAKKIWKIKQSEKEVFPIQTRVIDKIENIDRNGVTIERIHWKRDDKGQIITQIKNFKYTGVTIQERDEFAFLESERSSAHFAVIEEGARVDQVIANARPDNNSYADYAKSRTWENKYMRWQQTIQDYWIAIFKAYFGATDDDIKTIVFDDIVNYGEVALYKGGVKSPKSDGS